MTKIILLLTLFLSGCVSNDGLAACVPVVVEEVYVMSCAMMTDFS